MLIAIVIGVVFVAGFTSILIIITIIAITSTIVIIVIPRKTLSVGETRREGIEGANFQNIGTMGKTEKSEWDGGREWGSAIRPAHTVRKDHA